MMMMILDEIQMELSFDILFLQIVNIENGTELGPNEDGEICVRGPTVMKGRKQQ